MLKPVLFWKNSGLSRLAFLPALGLSAVIHTLLRTRHFLYDKGWLRSREFSTPVVCIGSLSVGGTGKTPMTEYLAGTLSDHGRSVVVIASGYRKRSGKRMIVVSDGRRVLCDVSEAGDEPFLLATNLLSRKIPVIAGPDRTSAIAFAEREWKPDLILLDDGFQDRKIHARRSILVQDYAEWSKPFRLLPLGRLRDLFLRRHYAHALVVAKTPPEQSVAVRDRVKNFGSTPIHIMHYEPVKLVGLDGSERSFSSWKDAGLIAVAGLGFFESWQNFIQTLALRHGATVAKWRAFTDHHWYSERDILRILSLHPKGKERYIVVTTPKDAVKIDRRWIPPSVPIDWQILHSGVRMADPALTETLLTTIPKKDPAA